MKALRAQEGLGSDATGKKSTTAHAEAVLQRSSSLTATAVSRMTATAVSVSAFGLLLATPVPGSHPQPKQFASNDYVCTGSSRLRPELRPSNKGCLKGESLAQLPLQIYAIIP